MMMSRIEPYSTEQRSAPKSRRSAPMMDLFPALTPYSTGYLNVSDGHDLYWEQSGNPDGVPVLLLHGGPGAGATPMHRRFFDPDHYRIIVFDQRGAGRSTPLGGLEGNTTANLVADIETLRTHLNVERWHLFGGSWGSTLALSYAAVHPGAVISMILRGIFLCEKEEIEWFLYGMRTIFPEAWEQFAGLLPEEEQDNLLDGYYERLTSDDEEIRLEAAIRWSLYEGACSSLMPNYETITTPEQKQHALALARLEAHYFKHEMISDKDSLIMAIEGISNDISSDVSTNLNGAVVQGLNALQQRVEFTSQDVDISTAGAMVVFTDGTDQAGRETLDNTLRAVEVASSQYAIFTIGLGDEIDESVLTRIGRDGFVLALNSFDLNPKFLDVARKVEREAGSFYILEYCSPKRSGEHTIKIRATADDKVGEFTTTFAANGFTGGCSID